MYEYRCTACGARHTSTTRADSIDSPCCGARAQRKWGFGVKPSVGEHFNSGLGKPIRNMAHFESELHRKADQMTERTGIPHSYEARDPRDKDALGVTTEGLPEQSTTTFYTP